jgi:predicted dehydrogenase
MNRRAFTLASLTAASYKRILGANDRVGVGFIGFGLIGGRHVYDFKNQKDADLVALSDTYQPRLEQGVQTLGPQAKGYSDFRKLLDDKNVQAVVVSTPDHWHALMSIMACAAGKDVYVEKPLTVFQKEGQWMMQAAKKYNRLIQVGTQQRSGRHYQKARQLMRDGYLGRVHSIRSASFRNVMPGFGAPADVAAPSELDYEMWLGPAPKRPYNKQRSLYHFRWFWDYSGGQMTNLGMHSLDIVQWVLGAKWPTTVVSTGGRYVLEDNGETPDTQDTIVEFDKCSFVWSHREASAGDKGLTRSLEFHGPKGTLYIGRQGFDIVPDLKQPPENSIPVFRGHPSGGPQRQEVAKDYWCEPMKMAGTEDEQFDNHVRNFLDCIKTRQQPIANVEEGHQVATTCHLANISLRVGRKLRWDGVKEEVIGDAEANQLLSRPYRKPWDQVLKSLVKV